MRVFTGEDIISAPQQWRKYLLLYRVVTLVTAVIVMVVVMMGIEISISIITMKCRTNDPNCQQFIHLNITWLTCPESTVLPTDLTLTPALQTHHQASLLNSHGKIGRKKWLGEVCSFVMNLI